MPAEKGERASDDVGEGIFDAAEVEATKEEEYEGTERREGQVLERQGDTERGRSEYADKARERIEAQEAADPGGDARVVRVALPGVGRSHRFAGRRGSRQRSFGWRSISGGRHVDSGGREHPELEQKGNYVAKIAVGDVESGQKSADAERGCRQDGNEDRNEQQSRTGGDTVPRHHRQKHCEGDAEVH